MGTEGRVTNSAKLPQSSEVVIIYLKKFGKCYPMLIFHNLDMAKSKWNRA